MTTVSIVLKAPDSAQLWKVRAGSENTIDFRHDRLAAEQCTEAFAAQELQNFLQRSAPGVSFPVVERRPERDRFIELTMTDRDTGGGFDLTPCGEGLVVAGHDRNGLVNGVYELLRLQGWRWLEPGPYGECMPAQAGLVWPDKPLSHIPSFRYRGVDAFRESDDSVRLLCWMARNRLNVVCRKPATGKFADKLGMYSRKGGHLLQRLLKPDALMDDGRTVWEVHPEWYGLPADGERSKETATRIQLCISQQPLLEYIGASVLRILKGDMADVDLLDLWGFDTWGQNCSCPACRNIGNGADQNLLLLTYIRDYLNRHLDRRVWINTTAYEGCATMDPPTHPAQDNLVEAGDMVIFYPIKRCYRHLLADGGCPLNRPYHHALEGWARQARGLSLWAGEYYNVSKFEDLPLVFMYLIPAEMRYYHAAGANGATFMHNLSPNWGVRALTQLQHAQYAWDVNTDDEAFRREYFERKYETHAVAMRSVYEKIEQGSRDISSWRNWFISALSVLNGWQGDRPRAEFSLSHFPTSRAVIDALRQSVALLDAALQETENCLAAEQSLNWKALASVQDEAEAVTPAELERQRDYDRVESRLGEDCRGLIYGADSMRLLLEMVEYHEALRLGGNDAVVWERIEALARKMSGYYAPLSYENPTPGIVCKDALSRTQLRGVITRCRGARLAKRPAPSGA